MLRAESDRRPRIMQIQWASAPAKTQTGAMTDGESVTGVIVEESGFAAVVASLDRRTERQPGLPGDAKATPAPADPQAADGRETHLLPDTTAVPPVWPDLPTLTEVAEPAERHRDGTATETAGGDGLRAPSDASAQGQLTLPKAKAPHQAQGNASEASAGPGQDRGPAALPPLAVPAAVTAPLRPMASDEARADLPTSFVLVEELPVPARRAEARATHPLTGIPAASPGPPGPTTSLPAGTERGPTGPPPWRATSGAAPEMAPADAGAGQADNQPRTPPPMAVHPAKAGAPEAQVATPGTAPTRGEPFLKRLPTDRAAVAAVAAVSGIPGPSAPVPAMAALPHWATVAVPFSPGAVKAAVAESVLPAMAGQAPEMPLGQATGRATAAREAVAPDPTRPGPVEADGDGASAVFPHRAALPRTAPPPSPGTGNATDMQASSDAAAGVRQVALLPAGTQPGLIPGDRAAARGPDNPHPPAAMSPSGRPAGAVTTRSTANEPPADEAAVWPMPQRVPAAAASGRSGVADAPQPETHPGRHGRAVADRPGPSPEARAGQGLPSLPGPDTPFAVAQGAFAPVDALALAPPGADAPAAAVAPTTAQPTVEGGAAPPPSPARSTLPQLPAMVVAAAEMAGDGTVEVALDPVELGALTITFRHEGEALRIVILAERPETLDLMRRNAGEFLADLRGQGFGHATLSFSGYQSEGHAKGQDAPATAAPSRAPATGETDLLPSSPARSTAGVDLRL